MKKNTFWFKLGSYAMIVTAGLHMIGHFSSAEPANDTEETLLNLMTTYQMDFGGIERSMRDLLQGYSLVFAASLFFVGVLNLMVARARGDDRAFLRTMTWMAAGYTGALLAISVTYFIYPPIVTIGVIVLCFVMSLLVGARRDQSPNRAR